MICMYNLYIAWIDSENHFISFHHSCYSSWSVIMTNQPGLYGGVWWHCFTRVDSVWGTSQGQYHSCTRDFRMSRVKGQRTPLEETSRSLDHHLCKQKCISEGTQWGHYTKRNNTPDLREINWCICQRTQCEPWQIWITFVNPWNLKEMTIPTSTTGTLLVCL